eukprot:TRINITY_DN66386_c0_g1_i1.p1 TRINITY_DN66386_c0_g1~~TRINITY_DN66386_c0_g1_i1.p1  ORF type:complete len:100 (-),score=20.50 TRINITY_DN66386_c0_g1_i1:281-580(-)
MWMQQNKSAARRALGNAVSAAVKFLNELRVRHQQLELMEQSGHQMKLVEGCYVSGNLYVKGEVVAEYRDQKHVWNHEAIEKTLAISSDDFSKALEDAKR